MLFRPEVQTTGAVTLTFCLPGADIADMLIK